MPGKFCYQISPHKMNDILKPFVKAKEIFETASSGGLLWIHYQDFHKMRQIMERVIHTD